MIGVIIMTIPTILRFLFVHPDWLRHGVAKRLWTDAHAHIISAYPTVEAIELNSTPHALKFYSSVGFIPISAEFFVNGCRATRMRYAMSGSVM